MITLLAQAAIGLTIPFGLFATICHVSATLERWTFDLDNNSYANTLESNAVTDGSEK